MYPYILLALHSLIHLEIMQSRLGGGTNGEVWRVRKRGGGCKGGRVRKTRKQNEPNSNSKTKWNRRKQMRDHMYSKNTERKLIKQKNNINRRTRTLPTDAIKTFQTKSKPVEQKANKPKTNSTQDQSSGTGIQQTNKIQKLSKFEGGGKYQYSNQAWNPRSKPHVCNSRTRD